MFQTREAFLQIGGPLQTLNEEMGSVPISICICLLQMRLVIPVRLIIFYGIVLAIQFMETLTGGVLIHFSIPNAGEDPEDNNARRIRCVKH